MKLTAVRLTGPTTHARPPQRRFRFGRREARSLPERWPAGRCGSHYTVQGHRRAREGRIPVRPFSFRNLAWMNQPYSAYCRNPCSPSSRAEAPPDSALAAASPRRMMPPMADLMLRRAHAAPGEVYDVLSGSRIVGRILLSGASAASQWVWTLSYDYHEDRTPTHGYAATRDAALRAFARSWNRET
jgi:hypothetical protein